jgi:exoribonuclease R
MSSQRLPGIYRVHEDPDPAKLEEVNRSLEALGYSLPRGRKIHTRMFKQLLQQVEGRPEERVINTLLLRAMRHARYAPAPLGHFGLATKYYTHFTSPIRRYPDLIVHRILRASIPEEGYFEPREWRPREDIRQHTGSPELESGMRRREAGKGHESAKRLDTGARRDSEKRRAGQLNKAAGAEDFVFETAQDDNGDRLSLNSETSTAEMTNEAFLLLDQDKKAILGKWFAKTGDAAKDAARNEALTWLSQNIPQIAEESSVRERAAEEAERESVEMKKVEYMQQHVGETFSGIVSGVTSFGMFVELENLVEGLVHVASLDDDYYVYVECPPSLIGERTKRRFRIGDPVQVELVRVNVDQRQIDFELTN